jgi:hypothetical protein
VKQIT